MNSNNILKNIFGFLLGVLFTAFIIVSLGKDNRSLIQQPLYLSQPIASEKLLISSAGQSISTYIIKDIANDLFLENTFNPSADASDLNDVESLVIVVGHSDIGEDLHNIDHEDEIKRVEALIDQAQVLELPIIGVYIGGKQTNHSKTNQLLELVFSNSTYNIVTSEEHALITKLFDNTKVPIIYVDTVKEINGPFLSIFR